MRRRCCGWCCKHALDTCRHHKLCRANIHCPHRSLVRTHSPPKYTILQLRIRCNSCRLCHVVLCKVRPRIGYGRMLYSFCTPCWWGCMSQSGIVHLLHKSDTDGIEHHGLNCRDEERTLPRYTYNCVLYSCTPCPELNYRLETQIGGWDHTLCTVSIQCLYHSQDHMNQRIRLHMEYKACRSRRGLSHKFRTHIDHHCIPCSSYTHNPLLRSSCTSQFCILHRIRKCCTLCTPRRGSNCTAGAQTAHHRRHTSSS